MLQFARFNEESAWHLGLRLRQFAMARKAPLVIDVRRFGHPLFYCALPGSSPDNAAWAQRKANTVARFHRSSYYMGLELQLKGTNLADRFGLTLNEFAAHGGSFPIAVAGTGSSDRRRCRVCRSATTTNWWWRHCALRRATISNSFSSIPCRM